MNYARLKQIMINGEIYVSKKKNKVNKDVNHPLFDLHQQHSFSKDHATRKKLGKTYNFSHIKPFIFAIISAIVIGSLFGIVMLHLLKGIDHNPSDAMSNGLENNEAETNEKESENKGFTHELEFLKAFVIQAGVFSERTNAENFASLHEEVPTVIWERENQYFLFIGIARTKEQGEELKAEYDDSDLELYVKEWSIEKEHVVEDDEVKEWIYSFQSLWEKTLQSISEQDTFFVKDWQRLIDEGLAMDDTSETAHLMDELLSEDLMDDHQAQQAFLLQVWRQVEQTYFQTD